MPDSVTNAVTSIACIVMAASALFYLPMQIYALVKLRGGWRLAALLPIVYVVGMVMWMIIMNAQITRDNPKMEPGVLLTIPLVFSMPIPVLYLAFVIGLGRRAAKRQAETAVGGSGRDR
jgi:hypothetical protein